MYLGWDQAKGHIVQLARSDVRHLPVNDPHSPSRQCGRCKGKGEVPWWTPESGTEMRPCFSCDGKGRYLTQKVKRQLMPVEVVE